MGTDRLSYRNATDWDDCIFFCWLKVLYLERRLPMTAYRNDRLSTHGVVAERQGSLPGPPGRSEELIELRRSS
jgi:hypothetical protein